MYKGESYIWCDYLSSDSSAQQSKLNLLWDLFPIYRWLFVVLLTQCSCTLVSVYALSLVSPPLIHTSPYKWYMYIHLYCETRPRVCLRGSLQGQFKWYIRRKTVFHSYVFIILQFSLFLTKWRAINLNVVSLYKNNNVYIVIYNVLRL
jgi:hypothetical protein